MELRREGLGDLLGELGGRWVVFHESGSRKPLYEIGADVLNSVVVVGGFPHGDFENRWLLERAAARYSLGEESLDAAQVVCRAVAAAEAAAGLV
jgi:rRNA small subunit pseudouridine methyltransferase Nep1